jgi:hypothetical protein
LEGDLICRHVAVENAGRNAAMIAAKTAAPIGKIAAPIGKIAAPIGKIAAPFAAPVVAPFADGFRRVGPTPV